MRSPKKGLSDQALGRSRGGVGTKLHLLVDEAQRLMSICLSPGQASDYRYGPELIKTAGKEGIAIVCADKGYDSEGLRKEIRELRMRPVIPKRGNSMQSPDFCPEVYRQRNRIERFIGRLKENRRVATRYDKKAATYATFIFLAAIKNWLRIIC